MQLSRAARCGRLCWRNTSPPPPRLCMSLAAQTWRFRCIVHRWELIIRFLLLLIFQLVFPPVRCPALLCSDSSLTPSLHLRRLCLPSSLMVIDGTRRLWVFFFFLWWMMAIICLGGRGDKVFAVNGSALWMGGWWAVADYQSFSGPTVHWRNVCVSVTLHMQQWASCSAADATLVTVWRSESSLCSTSYF